MAGFVGCVNLSRGKKMERRRYQRIFSQGISAEISDGIGRYTGVVSNVSMNGLMIEDLPPHIDGEASWYIIVIEEKELALKIFFKPKWSVLYETNRMIGWMVVDASWEWAEFVHALYAKTIDCWELLA